MPLSFVARRVARALAGIALVAAIAAGGSAAPATAADTGSISGTVTAPEGVEISRVSVVATRSSDRVEWGEVRPAADGSYTMGQMPPGSYTVMARGRNSGGYDTWYGGPTRERAQEVLLGAQQAVSGIELRVPLGATISGTASVPDGFSFATMRVSAEGGSTYFTTLYSPVDAFGKYLIKGLAPGSYRISFYPEDGDLLPNYYGPGGIYAPAAVTVTGTESITGIDAAVLRASSITGKISVPDRFSTEGMTVSARSEDNNVVGRGSIAPDGSYRVTHLFPGKFRIKVGARAAGLVDQWYTDGADPGGTTRVEAPAEANTGGIDLTLLRIPALVDVAPGNLFFDEINWLAARGITSGFPDATYRPLDSIHRDAMAAFLYRVAGRPEFTPPAKSPFSDVSPAGPFYREITWLLSEGITTGYPDGTYRPQSPVNRDAMAAFLYRSAHKVSCGDPAADSTFSDNPAGRQFHYEIDWMACFGISTGYPDGSYRPDEPVHRDAMAAFIKRWATDPGNLGLG